MIKFQNSQFRFSNIFRNCRFFIVIFRFILIISSSATHTTHINVAYFSSCESAISLQTVKILSLSLFLSLSPSLSSSLSASICLHWLLTLSQSLSLSHTFDLFLLFALFINLSFSLLMSFSLCLRPHQQRQPSTFPNYIQTYFFCTTIACSDG